jgi:hypothetical protein
MEFTFRVLWIQRRIREAGYRRVDPSTRRLTRMLHPEPYRVNVRRRLVQLMWMQAHEMSAALF